MMETMKEVMEHLKEDTSSALVGTLEGHPKQHRKVHLTPKRAGKADSNTKIRMHVLCFGDESRKLVEEVGWSR